MSDLNLLFENKISHIVIDDFLNKTQIDQFLRVMAQQPEWKEAEIPESYAHLFEGKQKPMHLFLTQYMIITQKPGEDYYLDLCKSYHEIWKRITVECGFDPYELLINYIKQHYQIGVKLASKNHQQYFPLVGRDLSEDVLPHADFGPYDGKHWVINQVVNQIAWNIYLTDPQGGGETIVYDKQWSDQDVLDENSYGIENFDAPIKAQFSIKPGRLVLFNSRNFHAVRKSKNPRIALGGLMGQTKNNEYIAWG